MKSPVKIDGKKTFAKNNVRFCRFIQLWGNSGEKYDEKYLEK